MYKGDTMISLGKEIEEIFWVDWGQVLVGIWDIGLVVNEGDNIQKDNWKGYQDKK